MGKAGRPTKKEQEKRRIDALLAEGKDANGEPIEEGQIISETRNEPKANTNGGYSISELENEIDSSVLDRNPQPKPEGNNINVEDFSRAGESSDDYVPPKTFNPLNEPIIENESDANAASRQQPTQPQGNPEVKVDFDAPNIGVAPDELKAGDKSDDNKEKKSINPDLDDLSPSEKRRQVELFAETILTTYAQLIPMIFVSIAQYNMGKMEVLDRDGVIRLTMVVGRDASGDLTIKEHFVTHNEEVEAVFVITDEQKEQIREPLIAVLLEKGIAPTPMVTLAIAVGSQMLQFGVAAYKFSAQKAEAINQFRAFRKEELENEREMHKTSQGTPTPTPKPEPKPEPEARYNTVHMEDAVDITDHEVNNVQPIQDGITIDEVTDSDAQ